MAYLTVNTSFSKELIPKINVESRYTSNNSDQYSDIEENYKMVGGMDKLWDKVTQKASENPVLAGITTVTALGGAGIAGWYIWSKLGADSLTEFDDIDYHSSKPLALANNNYYCLPTIDTGRLRAFPYTIPHDGRNTDQVSNLVTPSRWPTDTPLPHKFLYVVALLSVNLDLGNSDKMLSYLHEKKSKEDKKSSISPKRPDMGLDKLSIDLIEVNEQHESFDNFIKVKEILDFETTSGLLEFISRNIEAITYILAEHPKLQYPADPKDPNHSLIKKRRKFAKFQAKLYITATEKLIYHNYFELTRTKINIHIADVENKRTEPSFGTSFSAAPPGLGPVTTAPLVPNPLPPHQQLPLAPPPPQGQALTGAVGGLAPITLPLTPHHGQQQGMGPPQYGAPQGMVPTPYGASQVGIHSQALVSNPQQQLPTGGHNTLLDLGPP